MNQSIVSLTLRKKSYNSLFLEGLSAAVADLQKNQFQPRMERLKAIEKDIKSRMEEYALAEERMEVRVDDKKMYACNEELQFRLASCALETCNVLKYQ
jgi:hypothetical protein